MRYSPTGYIAFNLKKLKFYGGRELDIKAGGPDNPNTHFVLIL